MGVILHIRQFSLISGVAMTTFRCGRIAAYDLFLSRAVKPLWELSTDL